MNSRVHIDFETRSARSVKDCGAYTYARHPLTEITSIAFAVDNHPVRHIKPQDLLDPTCESVAVLGALASNRSNTFVAHNAFFEQCIWKCIMVERFGAPEIPIDNWECTAAKAAYMSLPRDLAGAGKVCDLPIQKDEVGNKVMMKLAMPRKGRFGGDIVFWEYEDCPEDFERLYQYNIQDVETERLLDRVLPPLPAIEQKIWKIDQAINFKGIQVDTGAVQTVLGFIEKTVAELLNEFRELVDYRMESPGQVAKLKEWLAEQGLSLADCRASTLDKVLGGDQIAPRIRRVLEIRRALSKISTSKYTALLDRVDSQDGRLRDILLYAAAITKRWGGRGVQLQNLPRGTIDSTVAIPHILTGDYEWLKGVYPDLMGVYSSCIRGMFIAPEGKELFVGDFSAIEAMVLPWLAGQESALEVFRQGGDIYIKDAAEIFGRPVAKSDKYERSVGKVGRLALGYNGSIGAYGSLARAYSLSLLPAYEHLWPTATEDEKVKARSAYNLYAKREATNENDDPLSPDEGFAADIIKQRFRLANPKIVTFWGDLEDAAITAVLSPGTPYKVGGRDGRPAITFQMQGNSLFCFLPSGAYLVYPMARVSSKETDWGTTKQTLSYNTQNETNYQFRTYTYGGKLAENITQAVARDLLAAALIRLHEAGFEIVLHVHDEVVVEVELYGDMDARLEEFNQIMATIPIWALGIPVKVESWRGKRYKK